ncbi:hypothetical protein GCK72_000936 [Caenorhabditis remanei]|uniref:E3 ubiquitin-protein ligase listerin n=1 Tax=Caenorhabditis remanei TaxID=31234 RepID=A0A6A5HTL2_CAERE|nr:hypothetical protein GCK72_000936 [Caenorhabditis remanei]KAF1769122.1 hypothetical protein GCK72_000936 [Caenorhabditis remanei]
MRLRSEEILGNIALGRKMSKQQRRKRNAKNASSASAHGYLSQGGETFVGLTPEMNIFEVASNNRLHYASEIDDETRIVMKKLTKKDCQTREKGLKELMNLVTTEKGSIESSYEHFCGLVPQLSTDGSPSVRLLTMKMISLFLIKLKKSASKGLKKIIPMVLFAKSDVTNGVAAAANAVIRDGFDADKKQQVMQLFAPITFDIAASIVQGKHDLAAPIEYDASEDKEARKSRLETQSLHVFLSYTKEMGSESNIWEEYAKKIFENSDYIRKAFAGKRETLKVQLLNLCYKFQNNVDILLSIPSIIPYMQKNLDVQTITPECATAWEGMILLLSNEKFQSAVSLQKGIFPRFLNVIRKKGNHWRVLKHYLLPAIVTLLKEMKNPVDDLKPLKSIMESFVDNLPWDTDVSLNAIHCWFNTFSDFVRWILSNDRVNLEIWETLSPLIIKITEQSMMFGTAEATESVSELLHWIIERKILAETDLQKLLESIETKIAEVGKEKSRHLRDSLTAPGKNVELSGLHANLFSSPELADFNIIKNLAQSEKNYFDATITKITSFSAIENTEQFDLAQASDVVQLISLILDSNCENLKISVKNDYVGRRLLLKGDSKIWENLLKQVPVTVFQEMINYWHEKRNGKAIAEAVSFLREKGIELDTNQAAENVDFLISLLQKLKSSDSNGDEKSIVSKLFAAIFESDEEPKLEHYQGMKEYLTADFNADHFFEKLFANSEENDIERILEIASRFDKLIELCEDKTRSKIVENLLLSKGNSDIMIERLSFLELEVLTFSQYATVIPALLTRHVDHLDEQETKKLVTEFSRIALFNLSSRYHTATHQVFGWQMISVISCVEQRYCLSNLNEELKNMREEIRKRVNRSDEVQNSSGISGFFADGYELSNEEEKKYLRSQTSEESQNESPLSPIQFMEKVFKGTESENEFQIFQFDTSNNTNWLINLIYAKRFIQCGGDIFSAENLELRDFSLCGIVTVLDNSTDILTTSPHAFDEDPRLEALTALYMDLYMVLTESIKSGNQTKETVEEWEEFYAPTIKNYFVRMFRTVRKDQQPTPFVRTLLKALLSISTFPADVPNDNVTAREFVPELSVFKYTPFEESCISQAFGLFQSGIEHVQLIGYAVSKLLMPIMFNTENHKALEESDEAEVKVSNRPKLALPVMLSKAYPVDHNHPHVGPLLLDLALIPLESSDIINFRQEQRVAYCDAIDPFFKNALNALMLDQPFEFQQMPITCRIPKLKEREYYLQTDYTASPVFFDKFASRLLFKSITLLPAAVRYFHKGMPKSYVSVFYEVVTKYASRLLVENELAKVSDAKFEGEMKVRTVPVTGQIIAEYIVEETKMKLTIELTPDYPLSVPNMTIDKAIVKNDKAKKWLMQLNAYLFHQNGAILEGIEMWKRNVDKGVEGVEDCTICMMTVHQQTHQLPKVRCKQCKNKFHSNCLYKWFESSNQSSCPLCRNNFT